MPTMQQMSEIRAGMTSATPATPATPAPANEPKKEEAPIGENPENPEEPVVTSGEQPGEQPGDGAAPGEDEVQYINELPDALGLDPEQFYGLKLKTESGKEYTWSEIKDKLQLEETAGSEILTKKQQLEAQEAQLASIIQQNQPVASSAEFVQAQQTYAALQQRQQQLVSELHGLQESEDFLGMARTQADITQIQTALGQLGQYLQTEQNTLRQQAQNKQQEHLQKQSAALVSKIPGWSENKKQISSEITEYLLQNEVSLPEIKSISDARVIGLIYKAMQYDRAQSGLQETVQHARNKTVRRIVRGAAGGGRTRTTDISPIIDKAKKSHSVADKKAAFRAVAQEAGLLGKE